MSKIGNKEYIDCPERLSCRPQPGLRNGVKWGSATELVFLSIWSLGEKKETVNLDGLNIRYRAVDGMKRMTKKRLKDV